MATRSPLTSIPAGQDISHAEPRVSSSGQSRRVLDGPAVTETARAAGRCARCARRFPRWARIAWMPGSGPVHAQCAPPGHQAGPMRAALVLAGRAADAAELRGWLQMCGLIAAPPVVRVPRPRSHPQREAGTNPRARGTNPRNRV